MDVRVRRGFDKAMVSLAGAAVVAIAVDMTSALRAVVVFAAVLLVPGAAIVRYLHPNDLPSFLGLAVVISLAAATVTSMALIWLDWWHPLALAVATCVLSCALLLWDIRGISRTLEKATA